MTSSPSKTLVVLGASYVGLAVTHKLLKKSLAGNNEYKVILVAPNTHHYWNLAGPRAIVPGQLTDEQIVQDIRPAFKAYPAAKFQHIVGRATALDTANKTVTIAPTGSQAPIEQKYDILVIATGSRSASPGPWKNSLNGHEETLKELHEVQAAVKAAKTIVIGGGGATGVESAGELAFEYGKSKEITLITGGAQLVSPTVPAGVPKAAANELKKLNVNVIYSTKVTSQQKTSDGKTELTLSNGQTKIVDLYIATLGLISNTEFVPKSFLNEKGEVKVDEFFKVKGAEGVFAAGDAADLQGNQLAFAQAQTPVLVKNLEHQIKGEALEAYKPGGPMIAVTVGRSRGTGHMGSFKFPSLMVWAIKGRTMFLQNLTPLVTGNA